MKSFILKITNKRNRLQKESIFHSAECKFFFGAFKMLVGESCETGDRLFSASDAFRG